MTLAPTRLEELLKVLAVLGAVGSFLWGVWVWKDKSDNELQQQRLEAQRLSESRRIEATKPFLERQLKLYTLAAEVAAVIATSEDPTEQSKAVKRFWQLYWGELALVENSEVEGAMVKMGQGIRGRAGKEELQQLSLALAHACRRSLDKSWGIHAWAAPDHAAAATDP